MYLRVTNNHAILLQRLVSRYVVTLYTHHVNDLRQRQSERNVERLAGVQRRSYSVIVVPQQVAYQPVLNLVRFTYTTSSHASYVQTGNEMFH